MRAAAVLEGVVVKGRGLGRKLGFPTANLRISSRRGRLPRFGVYSAEVEGRGLKRKAVCNLGTNPTVTRGKSVKFEVHIPGFKGNLYRRKLKVRLVRFLRGERKFASLDALKAQIAKDVRRCSS